MTSDEDESRALSRRRQFPVHDDSLFSDYHLHPQGHRHQPYTPELLQPWADHARQIGLRDFALTDHDRYHPGVDFDEIDRLRAANPDLNIRAGIELDNDPEGSAAGRAWVEKNWDRLDFVLGSVHFLERPDQMFDSVPDGAEQFAGRDIDEIYADYFQRVREVAASGLVDCLAHLDLIKIHGHRPRAKIETLVGETLDFIAARGLCLELSTAGWRKPVTSSIHPTKSFIWRSRRGFPSRPHRTDIPMCNREKTSNGWRKRWSQMGIHEVCVFERHRRRLVAL